MVIPYKSQPFDSPACPSTSLGTVPGMVSPSMDSGPEPSDILTALSLSKGLSKACRTKGLGLLRVDPERRFFTPPQKAGRGAAERVKGVAMEKN